VARVRTLEDFLKSRPLTVDGVLDDGWGASFPVKGIEIDATVLYADISGFTERTADLTSVETLAYVNNFFAWVTAEALEGLPVLVDKYIGDEIMVVFSVEFGSKDPFVEAVQAARWMAEHDALSFAPHMGLASGPIVIGYVGTPLLFSCSVFGRPVAIANRCTSADLLDLEGMVSSSITFPVAEWRHRKVEDVIEPVRYRDPDDQTIIHEQPLSWELLGPKTVPMKGLGDIEVCQLVDRTLHLPSTSAEDRAKQGVAALRENGYHRGRPGHAS
jgi:class 3 adenylate cyclase